VRALSIITHSEDQTAGLAGKLAASFVAGDVLVLSGRLGSGKTTFVRALAKAKGIDENIVRSPSFAFVNEYGGDPPLYHFDLYRLGEISELYEIGWDEYLSRNGIMMVEWGERAEDLLPPTYYLIEFSIVSDYERQIDISRVQR
jgi:tRNA threonylcarbamoyladenosine biosynthesis protein TsaE